MRQNGLKDVKLGGALVLPYFKFTPDNISELHASSENFLMNTQASLSYYHTHLGEVFDAVYLFLNSESEGTRYDEVAGQMGLSAGALRMAVHRMAAGALAIGLRALLRTIHRR